MKGFLERPYSHSRFFSLVLLLLLVFTVSGHARDEIHEKALASENFPIPGTQTHLHPEPEIRLRFPAPGSQADDFSSRKTDYLTHEMDQTVNEAVRNHWMPVAKIGIYFGNRVLLDVKAGSFPGHPVPIASLTKSFTAILVMQLAERGFLQLDQPVSDFGILLDGDNRAHPLTVRHLMQQTSGIGYGGTSIRREPGTSFEYSNSNYRLLAQLIQKVTGKSYPAVLKEQITDPLGMKSTYSSPVYMGHSGISSTEKDLQTFGAMLASGGQWKGQRILRQDSLEEMLQPPPFMKVEKNMFYYSHGFRVEVKDGRFLSFYHTGVWNGTLAEVRVYPESGIYIVQLATPPSYKDKTFQEYRWRAVELAGQFAIEASRFVHPESLSATPPGTLSSLSKTSSGGALIP